VRWLALALAALALQTVPLISVDPTSGEPGTAFQLTGSGFAPEDRVRVLWDGVNLGGNVKVGADGTFTYSGTFPPDTTPGPHVVEARGRVSGAANLTVTVTAPPTTSTTTTTSPPVTTIAPPTSTTATPTPTAGPVATTVPVTTSSTGAVANSTTTAGTATTSIFTTTSVAEGDGIGVTGGVAAGMGAMAVVGVLTTLLLSKRPSSPANAALPEEQPVPRQDALPAPLPEVEQEQAGWVRHRIDLAPGGRLEGLAGDAEGFLGFGQLADTGLAGIWKSRDGRSWDLLTALDEGRAGFGIPWRNGWLILGSTEVAGQPTACSWSLSDLTNWRRLTSPEDSLLTGMTFDGAVATDEAVVAWGRGPLGAAAWISRDGGYWERPALPGSIDLVACGLQGLIAFGRHPEERRPIVACSPEGLSWQELKGDALFVFEAAAIASVAPFDGGLVAVGTDKMRGAAAVWVSDDGDHWHRTPFEASSGTSMQHLVVMGDRLVTVGADAGERPTGRAAVAVWHSEDAVSWQRIELPDLFSAASASSVAVSGDALVISGKLVFGHASPESISVAWVLGGPLGASDLLEGQLSTLPAIR
jgi:hypothetical protein